MARHLDPARECACTSGAAFGACCAPYLRGAREPEHAAQLMRSRFTAFALEDVDWLWKTLHSTHEDRSRPEAEVRKQLRKSCRTFDYVRLDILEESEGDGRATVTFRAHLRSKGVTRAFVEKSQFLHDGTGWRYVSGEAEATA